MLAVCLPAAVCLTGCGSAGTEDAAVSVSESETQTETESVTVKPDETVTDTETESTADEETEDKDTDHAVSDLYYAILLRTHPVKYSEYVDKYSKKYNVPKDVIYAVIKTESGFRYDAVSSTNARGLMQLMEETYEWLCGREGLDPAEHSITDPETNIMLGVSYIAFLYDEFGVWDTVYAAYNAGQGIVRKWLADEQYGKDGRLVSIPFKETSAFVIKVRNARAVYAEILKRTSEE